MKETIARDSALSFLPFYSCARMSIVLDADVLHLLIETLGPTAFLRATCCRAWLAAANALPPNHALWEAACTAESPLLAAMHGEPNKTWRALLKQRRTALLNITPSKPLLGYRLAYELRDARTAAIVRSGVEDLDVKTFMHTFLLSEPLRLIVDDHHDSPSLLDCPCLNNMRLNLFLIAPDSRMRLLAHGLPHYHDRENPWYTIYSEYESVGSQVEFEITMWLRLLKVHDDHDYDPDDDPECHLDTLLRLELHLEGSPTPSDVAEWLLGGTWIAL